MVLAERPTPCASTGSPHADCTSATRCYPLCYSSAGRRLPPDSVSVPFSLEPWAGSTTLCLEAWSVDIRKHGKVWETAVPLPPMCSDDKQCLLFDYADVFKCQYQSEWRLPSMLRFLYSQMLEYACLKDLNRNLLRSHLAYLWCRYIEARWLTLKEKGTISLKVMVVMTLVAAKI